ncbi:hypothetical protein J4E89_000212 [Alternaria sp. Ai002NY15]|nr:hypothetical protein J4E89_000212 [Alternaria sp. Ai002NY15]
MALNPESTGLTITTGDQIARINQLKSPFLRLPAELRNLIYLFTFTDSVIRMHPRKGEQSATNPIGLICCCRQLRHEANSLFGSTATFGMELAMPYSHEAAIAAIGAERCARITSIQISLLSVEFQYVHWAYPAKWFQEEVELQGRDNANAFPALNTVHAKGSRLQLSLLSSDTRADLVRAFRLVYGKPAIEIAFETGLEGILRAADDGQP